MTKQKQHRISLSISKELHDRLKQEAAIAQRSISNYVAVLIIECFKNIKK